MRKYPCYIHDVYNKESDRWCERQRGECILKSVVLITVYMYILHNIYITYYVYYVLCIDEKKVYLIRCTNGGVVGPVLYATCFDTSGHLFKIFFGLRLNNKKNMHISMRSQRCAQRSAYGSHLHFLPVEPPPHWYANH